MSTPESLAYAVLRVAPSLRNCRDGFEMVLATSSSGAAFPLHEVVPDAQLEHICAHHLGEAGWPTHFLRTFESWQVFGERGPRGSHQRTATPRLPEIV